MESQMNIYIYIVCEWQESVEESVIETQINSEKRLKIVCLNSMKQNIWLAKEGCFGISSQYRSISKWH